MNVTEEEDLIYQGRVKGNNLLQLAVETAKDNKQLSDKVFVYRRMAIFIIAVEAYNDKAQNEKSFSDFMLQLNTEIEDEVLCFAAGEKERLHPQDTEVTT